MVFVNLDDPPPYKALSYTWGSPSDLYLKMFIDNHIFMARENLWQALDQLDYNKSIDVIWIDAVYINQSDIRERNDQVRKMKAIYKRAQEVIVWLGLSYNTFPEFQLAREPFHHRDSADLIKKRMKAADAIKLLESLSPVLNREYWWRIWIVQELTVASKVVLLCGNDSCSMDAVLQVQALFHKMQDSNQFPHGFLGYCVHDVFLAYKLRHCGPWAIQEWQKTIASQKPSFFECILIHHRKEVSDPRDMVYGLAALANSISGYQVDIDYSLSRCSHIYRSARLEKCYSQKLAVLSRVRVGTSRNELPSWVHDWSSKEMQKTCLWTMFYLLRQSIIRMLPEPPMQRSALVKKGKS